MNVTHLRKQTNHQVAIPKNGKRKQYRRKTTLVQKTFERGSFRNSMNRFELENNDTEYLNLVSAVLEGNVSKLKFCLHVSSKYLNRDLRIRVHQSTPSSVGMLSKVLHDFHCQTKLIWAVGGKTDAIQQFKISI